MASTALTTISDSDGKTLVRFLRRNFGHVSGYSHALLSFLSRIEIRNDRQPDEKTYHGMGFLAPMLIAHITHANGDTFLISPDTEGNADFRFAIFERNGEVFVRCEDSDGLIFETNATKT